MHILTYSTLCFMLSMPSESNNQVKEMEAVEDFPEAVHQTFGAVEDLPGADIVVVDAV